MIQQGENRAEERIVYLGGQLERVEEELQRARDEKREQEERLEQIEEQLSAHQQKLAGVEEEINRRKRVNEEQTRKVGELAALKDRYSHQVDYLSQRMQKLEATVEREDAESRAGKIELERAREFCRDEESVVSQWRERNEAAEGLVGQLESSRAKIEKKREEIETRLRRVVEDLRIAKARLTFIGDSDRDRSGFPPAAKKISEDYDVRALVDMIDVEPGYEKAVSAVLGSALFALTAASIEAADEMLRAAREAKLGSVEFILDGPTVGPPGIDAGEESLLEHVTVPAEASFLTAILRNVRLVEDVSGIRGTGGGSVCVTRDGVVYNADRRLLSFKADPPSSVVLKQRNERRHLEQERDEADRLHRRLEETMADLAGESRRFSGKLTEAEHELRETSLHLQDAENRLAGTRRRCSVLEQEIELKQTSHTHLQAERESLESELLNIRRRLLEAEEGLAAAQPGTAAGSPDDEETLAARKHALSQQVTDLQITTARMRERERVAGVTIERTAPALKRLSRDKRIAARQLAAFRAFGPAGARLFDAIKKLERVHVHASASMESELKEAEERSNKHSTSLRELSHAETRLQQELSRASDKSTEMEVNVTRLRDHHDDVAGKLSAINERHPDAGLAELDAAGGDELDEIEGQVERLLRRRELIGPVNPLAQQEYEELLERKQFLEEQRNDLEKSLAELTSLIKELTVKIETAFSSTFDAVQKYFSEVVATLFPGGEGRLTLTEAEAGQDDDETDGDEEEDGAGYDGDRRGIEISVKPARKAVRSLSLLSGGERSLVAIAFLFSIFLARPAPFYILDEVEAALDDQNITRLIGMLRRFQDRTQFIVITHQKRTMEVADVLYGVSMGADGTSKILSRKMEELDESVRGTADEGLADDEREHAAVAG
jgi:chromosome segregation protein